MKKIICIVLMSVLSLYSAENTWQGVNYSATGSTVSNVDDSASWSLNRIPGVGNDDGAVFLFQSDRAGAVQEDLYIWSTNQFAPSSIYFDGNNGAENWTQDRDLYIEKSLTVTNFTVRTDTTSSGRQGNRVRLNNTGSGAVLTIAGDTAIFDISGAFWEALNLKNDIIFTATNIYFPESDKGGGVIAESSSAYAMTFTNSASTINLSARAGAAMHLGNMRLFARTGQTWNCDTHAYISMNIDGTRNLVDTSDAGRLDNLGEVSFIVGHSRYGSGSSITIPGGTYRSLSASGGGSRSFGLTASGSLNFAGTLSNGSYGLRLQSPSSSFPARLYLNGYDLNLQDGDLVFNQIAILYAAGSHVTINGNLNILGTHSSAGIRADADTVINLSGSYSNEFKTTITSGLYESEVNMVGNGTNQYFEVGDAYNVESVSPGNLSIGTFNVGAGTTNATVILVNNFLNNNPVVNTNENDKIGEKLVVDQLNIASNSTFDMNGQIVKLGPVLNIEETGWLDLNTGIELYNGYVVTNFYSTGGRYSDWLLMQDRVKDSSQPEFYFRPKLFNGVSTPYGADSALNFDGINDYVNLSTGDGLDISTTRTPFTVELWMKGEETASDGWGYAIHRGTDDNVGSSVYWIGVNGFSGKYGAAVSGNITAGTGDTDVDVEPGVWHHIALTYDGTNQSIYIDGVLKRGPSNIGAIGNSRSNNKIGIGSSPHSSTKRPIEGNIGEVRIWDYTRSGTEIADNMNKQMTGAETGLVGYWPLDDGVGNVAEDFAGDNDGTLINGPFWSSGDLYWEVYGGPAEGTLLIVR